VLGGANWYPDDTRNLRVNLNATYVNREIYSAAWSVLF
jgi:hypothetical protein